MLECGQAAIVNAVVAPVLIVVSEHIAAEVFTKTSICLLQSKLLENSLFVLFLAKTASGS